MPEVSVIVPVYNAEKTLHKCISSILSQTFKDFELILVIDGATDSSIDICSKFAQTDNRICIVEKENNGVSAARNSGLDNATGKYVTFVDSDDYVSSDFLAELVAPMKSGINFALCGYMQIDCNTSEEQSILPYEDNKLIYGNINTIIKLNSPPFISQPWNKIFRRDIIDKNKIRFPENISLGEDMIFNFRYLDQIIDEKYAIINKPLYNYYINNNYSLLKKYRPDLFETNVFLNEELDKFLSSWDIDNETRVYLRSSFYYRMENVLFNTFNAENSQSLAQKLKYNRSVIKSNEFKKYLSSFTGNLNLLFKLSYKLNTFFFIWLVRQLRGETKRK